MFLRHVQGTRVEEDRAPSKLTASTARQASWRWRTNPFAFVVPEDSMIITLNITPLSKSSNQKPQFSTLVGFCLGHLTSLGFMFNLKQLTLKVNKCALMFYRVPLGSIPQGLTGEPDVPKWLTFKVNFSHGEGVVEETRGHKL